MENCIFCRIIAGDLPASFLHQDDRVVAFRDINPAAPTHVLIVPREHLPDLRHPAAAEPALLAAVFRAVQHIAETEGVSAEGFRVVANTGAKAGQTVPHLHFHLLGGREFNAL